MYLSYFLNHVLAEDEIPDDGLMLSQSIFLSDLWRWCLVLFCCIYQRFCLQSVQHFISLLHIMKIPRF